MKLTIEPLCAPCMQDSALPLFDKVKPEDVVPGMTALLGDLHKEITRLEEVSLRAPVTPQLLPLPEIQPGTFASPPHSPGRAGLVGRAR